MRLEHCTLYEGSRLKMAERAKIAEETVLWQLWTPQIIGNDDEINEPQRTRNISV